jgi:uncharacterized membrane protein YagU involved in acid resistance
MRKRISSIITRVFFGLVIYCLIVKVTFGIDLWQRTLLFIIAITLIAILMHLERNFKD